MSSGAAGLFDLAFVHNRHAVGEIRCFFLIVRHEDGGQPHFAVRQPEPTAQFRVRTRIERAERLVEQQRQVRSRVRARECNALALAASWLG